MKTTLPEPCQHIAIAHGSTGHIAICPECNVVHVVLGHVTLRFAPEVFRDAAHMFGQAQARLDHVYEASAAAEALIDAPAQSGPSLH